MNCGGFSAETPVDEGVRALVMKLKPNIEAKMNATYTVFEPTVFSCQVVAGTNYCVKINVGDGKTITAKIFEPLPCEGTEPELTSVC